MSAIYEHHLTIPTPGPPALTPEIAFSPEGKTLAVTYLDNDQVALYDTDTFECQRILCNPAAELDRPHGVLLTERHLIVANRHERDRPATFKVYLRSGSNDTPTFTLQPALSFLREGHSMALHGDLLIITHTGNDGHPGAVLSYRFDEDTGQIEGPLDVCVDAFDNIGKTKGVAFTPDGESLIITVNIEQQLQRAESLRFNLYKLRNILRDDGVPGILRKALNRKHEPTYPGPELGNGLVELPVSSTGRFAAKPSRVAMRQHFCRLENVTLSDDHIAIADTVNHRVELYEAGDYLNPGVPVQIINEGLSLPHAVKLSPDGSLLVVSNYGLENRNQLIHWGYFQHPRADNLMVFKRSLSRANRSSVLSAA